MDAREEEHHFNNKGPTSKEGKKESTRKTAGSFLSSHPIYFVSFCFKPGAREENFWECAIIQSLIQPTGKKERQREEDQEEEDQEEEEKEDQEERRSRRKKASKKPRNTPASRLLTRKKKTSIKTIHESRNDGPHGWLETPLFLLMCIWVVDGWKGGRKNALCCARARDGGQLCMYVCMHVCMYVCSRERITRPRE